MDGSLERRQAVRDAILIAGPTASGKTALAVDLARQHGGVVVNADSMQVYDVLDILTARPSAAELAAAPHLLFGHVSPLRSYSTGEWLRDVVDVLERRLDGRKPIFVGGTGLYFKALSGGLSHMPMVPAAMRDRFRTRLNLEGPDAMYRELELKDAGTARQLNCQDGQRIIRALEVLEASGKSIRHWQSQRGSPVVDPGTARKIILEPDREWLRTRIERRFHTMIERGALAEVERLIGLSPDPALPAMKAIGVPEIMSVLRGERQLDDAVADAITASRQYAKRQMTWFRNQMDDTWERLPVF